MDQNKINITIFVYIHCISNKYDNIYISIVNNNKIKLCYYANYNIQPSHSLINNIH